MEKNIIFIGVFAILIFGCTSSKDIIGTYVQQPLDYIADSLFIYDIDTVTSTSLNKKQYKYQQKIYSKRTGRLIYKHWDYWYLEKGITKIDINFNNLIISAIDSDPDKFLHTKEQIENAKILFTTYREGKNITSVIDLGTGKMRHYKKVK